jgi:2,4-dienoyl-CoA reductase (NADPH2)
MTAYPHLFTPIAAGPFTLPNRIIMGWLKRSPGPFGRTLGKTTGWVHRLALQRAGVRFLDGVTYRALDEDALRALGIACTYVGGAKVAAELDAKRAIEDGARIGLAL